jgi:hypothetical protein
MLIMRALLLAALSASLSSHALADPGVTVLSAECAPVGCLDSDPPGLPIVITQSGHYRLHSDLQIPLGGPSLTAIRINAPGEHVTLDLNGHMIRGGKTCTDTPAGACTGLSVNTGLINVENLHSGRIKNGRIQGGEGYGIRLRVTGPVELERLHLTENVDGVHIDLLGAFSTATVRLRDSQIVRNQGNGVRRVDGTGLILVENSLIHGNGSFGVEAGSGTDGTLVVRDSHISNNFTTGLIGRSLRCRVYDSSFYANFNSGTQISSCTGLNTICRSGTC